MDIKHFYIEKGQGEPVLLLHGNGEDSSYFKGQIDEFSRWYHVCAMDTRGHGKTPRGERPFTIRQFAEDLLGFMDEHEIKKTHLLGFSDGGNIAMVFAIHHPERVNKLILNGANLNAGGVKRRVQIPIEIGYWTASRFAGKSASAKRNAEMLGLMVNDPNVPVEELALIQAKTLVIAGTKDMIKEEHTRVIASGIPDAELCFIDGDHFIANKKAEVFNDKVLEFLSKDEKLEDEKNRVKKKGQYLFCEWDEAAFVLPNEYMLNESSDLADALYVFYSAGGYDFFNVVDPRYYSDKWLNFVGGLYKEIENGKYVSGDKHYVIPLDEEQRQELLKRGVPDIFVVDI